MLPSDITLPEIESLLVAWSTGLFTSAQSMTELPDDLEAELPVIQWYRIGGIVRDPTLDESSVDYDVYAADRPSAAALANQVRAAILYKLPGHVSGSFVVTATSEVSAPAWRPYDNTRLRRYGGTVDITCHLTNT